MRSQRFRLVLATLLAVVGVAMTVLLLFQLDSTGVPWAHDFLAYYHAAARLVQGSSPYVPEQLNGSFESFRHDFYLYPPLFAQVLSPLTLLPAALAEKSWFILQVVAMVVALWFATGIGGARRSLERAVWCVVATTFFLPVFSSLWYGNVGTLLALSTTLVAMGGAVAGLSAALGTLVKIAPVTLIPAAFVMDQRSRRTLVLGLMAISVASFLLAPNAWLEYPTVLRNLLIGSVDHADNLAPANLVARSGLPAAAGTFTRAAALVIALGSLAASVWLARKHEGIPVAVLFGTVALLLGPGTMWYHYLAILLPFAAMAWPGASGGTRVALFVSSSLIVVGVSVLPLALAGAVGLVVVCAHALWPRPSSGASHAGVVMAG